MGHRYGVLGAGRQGTAAAYDMVVRGGAGRVRIGDVDPEAAARAAERVNALVEADAAEPARVDAADRRSVVGFLEGVESFLSAVPYVFNLEVTRAAIDAGAHMCDLGGNTALVRRQLELGLAAEEAGISLMPDCGQVPGMGTSLMVYAMGLLDEADEVRMWDGGLPQEPKEPWNYELSFHINGLTNEYDGSAIYLRDGRIVEVECFDPAEYELIEFPEPLGTLEAFATAGGTSTAPRSFEGELRTFENRTLRYPGHAAAWKAFRDAGLFGRDAIRVGGVEVVPRELFHTLMSPRIETGDALRDVVVIRVIATGRKEGRPAEAQLDLVDWYDGSTGFTAMQRTTGWDGAIVASMMARGDVPPGAQVRERALDATAYVRELRRRGFDLKEEVRPAREEVPHAGD